MKICNFGLFQSLFKNNKWNRKKNCLFCHLIFQLICQQPTNQKQVNDFWRIFHKISHCVGYVVLNLDKESDECVKWRQTWSSLIFLPFFDMLPSCARGYGAYCTENVYEIETLLPDLKMFRNIHGPKQSEQEYCTDFGYGRISCRFG